MDEFEKFYNSALRFLSYRPRSEKEVRDRLFRLAKKNKKLATAETRNKDETRKFSASDNFSDSVVAGKISIIDKVIQKLKEKKFINDEEFAKWWIESRSAFRIKSIKFIKMELQQKGVNKDIVDRIIHDSEFSPRGEAGIIQNDLEQAKKLVEKRIERLKDLKKQEIYQKLGRYLASKGFDWDTIKKSIDYVHETERS